MAAPAVPEVPAVAALLAAAASAIVWLVALGMLYVWRRSLGKLLVWMADQLDRASVTILHKSFHIFGPLSKLLRSLEYTVDHYLGEAVVWGERSAATLFSFFITVQVWMAAEIADLATDVWHALRVNTSTITHTITKTITHTVVKPITKTVTVVKATGAAAITRLTKQVHAIDVRLTKAVHAAAHAVAGTLPRIRGLERRVETQGQRLTRLEKAAATAVGAAVVLTALKRLGLGWLRCNNVGKAGKAVCGMDASLLESLLLDAALLSVAFNIETFAKELQGITHEAATLITDFAE